MVWLKRKLSSDQLRRNNIFLLICLVMLVLFFPIFTMKRELLGDVMLSGVVFASIFSLNFVEKTRKILMTTGGTTIVLIWLSYILPNRMWALAAFINLFFYQIIILFYMIRHVGRSQNVTGNIILNAVNGYLIIGFLGSLLLAMAELFEWYFLHIKTPLINMVGEVPPAFHDYLYFSFVTVTTLGYGDITPANALAKSIAIMIAISGQLYLTVLVAMLVGKYLGRSKTKN